MRAAEPARSAVSPRGASWGLALVGLLAAAFALRAWGAKHGLPYVYNADENAHFVPRAIGMFGHSYNPGYFINPPAFTYLLHAAFWLRWGGRDEVGDAFALDPGDAFLLARLLSGLLGAASVGLLAWAGARMLGRRIGLLAGALLCVAFLPVHYAHYALNDVPTLAPLCLALVGAAGIARGGGRTLDHVLAGAGLGLAIATKYTAGIVLVTLAAAVAVAPGPRGPRLRGATVALAAAVAGFLVANPYALLDLDTFRAGLEKQSSASNDGGGKLGLGDESALLYYLRSLTWGLGWIPLAAAAAGAVVLALRDRRAALVLAPAPVLLMLFLGSQDRFFARWLLPAYPLLCLLAAVGALAAADWLITRAGPWRPPGAWLAPVAAAALLCAQGLVFSLHNDVVLARADTRMLARDWMVAHVPEGAKIVAEPISPDQWATDIGRPSPATGNGARWNKWPTSRSRVRNDGTLIPAGRPGRIVKLEDYERTTRPELVGAYARGGYCWVLTGSTQFGRARAEPAEVPDAERYYDALRARSTEVHRVSPYGAGSEPVPFSFDFSFNSYPLAYEHPGPEIVIYRLRDCPE